MTRVLRNTSLIVAATAALATTPLLPGLATAATHSAHSSDLTTTIQVVATGLNVPRGLVYDRAHERLLIAQAGVAAGNTGPCAPGEGGTILCYGPTGSILAYSLDSGHTREIISGLPSISDTGKTLVLGLHDLSLSREKLTGVFGLLGTPATRTGLGPGAADLGQAVTFSHSGEVTPIADVATFETQLYGSGEESDPYGITTGKFGTVIANAGGHAVSGNYGGNDILRLKHGDLDQIAAFPQRVPAENPNDIVESVPTTVERGPDGAFYVGELTGFPYYLGEARVWRVVPGQAPTIFASGFTNIIDIAFDSEGRLLVLEIAAKGLLNADQTGALIRVDRNGTQTVLASTGLTNPGGLAVVNDNTFYVTNNTTGVGGDGQLLKIHVEGDS